MAVNRRQFLNNAGALGAMLGAVQSAEARLPADVDFDRVRELYDVAPEVTYLNHGSIGTMPRAVREGLERYLRECETNPWLYMWGQAWDPLLESVRRKAGRAMACSPKDVAIVHNTTEAFNTLAQGLPLKPGDEVLFSNLNHAGASVCWHHRANERGFSVRTFDLPLDDMQDIDAGSIVQRHVDHINAKTRVLVFPHVDNIVGLRHPVRELARAAREKGVRWIAVDGAQTVGMLPVDVGDMGVDMFATSAHKWAQAPKGLGLLYASPRLRDSLRAMWVTWGQTRYQGTARLYEDYGTRALPQALALGLALDFQARFDPQKRANKLEELRKYAFEQANSRPGLSWESPRRFRRGASLYAIGLKSAKPSRVARALFEQHGVVVRPFELDKLNSLRVSPNLMNTRADITRLFRALDQIV